MEPGRTESLVLTLDGFPILVTEITAHKNSGLFVKFLKNSSQKEILRTVIKNGSQLYLGTKICLGTQIWRIVFSAFSMKIHLFAKVSKVSPMVSIVARRTLKKQLKTSHKFSKQ